MCHQGFILVRTWVTRLVPATRSVEAYFTKCVWADGSHSFACKRNDRGKRNGRGARISSVVFHPIQLPIVGGNSIRMMGDSVYPAWTRGTPGVPRDWLAFLVSIPASEA